MFGLLCLRKSLFGRGLCLDFGARSTHNTHMQVEEHRPGRCRAELEEMARLLGVEPELLRGGLNLVAAANVLGIAASTLRQRALHGLIGCERDGRRWIFRWWHLAAYMQRRERQAAELAGRQRPRAIDRTLDPEVDCAGQPGLEAEARALGLI